VSAPLDLERLIAASVERALAGALADLADLRLLRVGEAAALLAVGETTVRALLRAGDLEALRVRSEVRVTVASIRAYQARQREAAHAAPRAGGRQGRVRRLV
jgi:excisionase family DNA binding protein